MKGAREPAALRPRRGRGSENRSFLLVPIQASICEKGHRRGPRAAKGSVSRQENVINLDAALLNVSVAGARENTWLFISPGVIIPLQACASLGDS